MDKKTFRDSPAMRHIDIEAPEQASEDLEISREQEAPARRRTASREARSRRLQILLQPSLHKKLIRIAEDRGDSLNNLIHKTLEELVRNV